METILLTNIGNRNLIYNGEFIGKNKSKGDNFFEESKMLFEEFENEKDFIQLNILPPLLDKYHPSEIYLFVTHQDIPFLQDTYYIGEISKKILEKQGIKVHLISYQQDPRLRDQAFLFFEQFFEQHQELKEKNVIVSGSGGVPAMKEALHFYAVVNLQNPKIVDVDENTNTVMESNIAQEYLKKFQKETLLSFIKHYDYGAAYQYLSSPNCLISSVTFKNKLLYLHRKYNFDLTKANTQSDDKFPCFSLLQIVNPEAELSRYLNQKKMNLIYLLDNIEISYKKGEYTSILGKLFALKETYARRLLEDKIQSKTEYLNESHADQLISNFGQYCRVDRPKELHRSKSTNGKREIKTNTKEYYLTIDESKIPNIEYSELLDSLKKLNTIRNESIMAHGFKGISKGELDNVNIIEIIKNIKHKTFGQKKNMFEEANNELIKLIQEL